MRLVLLVTIFTILGVSSRQPGLQKPIRYDNFSVYKIHIQNSTQRNLVNSLLSHSDNYNLWFNGRTEMHVMINPQELSNFKRIMRQENIIIELLIPNVQALIDAERST